MVLFSWLSDVCDELKCQTETFYLAVNYVDRRDSLTSPNLNQCSCCHRISPPALRPSNRYLQQIEVSRRNFQLVGITALWVAAKFEEIYPPTSEQLLDLAAGAYT